MIWNVCNVMTEVTLQIDEETAAALRAGCTCPNACPRHRASIAEQVRDLVARQLVERVTALPQNAPNTQSVVDAARAIVAVSDALIGARGDERNDLEMELVTKINGARMYLALMDARKSEP